MGGHGSLVGGRCRAVEGGAARVRIRVRVRVRVDEASAVRFRCH